MIRASKISLLMLLLLAAFPCAARDAAEPFALWVAQLREEARGQGISDALLDTVLPTLSPDEDIIELDRKQPETTQTLQQYLNKIVSQARIERGRQEFEDNEDLLRRIGRQYGVQPEYIVALWGIESNFGDRMGDYSIVEALATLAYDGRRSEYFRGELLKALRILQNGDVTPENMLGSWAGAMGQCQFMPSSYLRYAVDQDGDGRRDIWETQADVFASIAHYLQSEGWDPASRVGTDGRRTHNFNVLMKWNRSTYFATAVGTLASRIAAGS
jgi:membrane-bound lytic murein transglycosylase B